MFCLSEHSLIAQKEQEVGSGGGGGGGGSSSSIFKQNCFFNEL